MRPPHPAREVARLVARAGWPVIPLVTSTDDKVPCVAWKRDPASVCRCEADVMDKWPASWPRWAAICGVPRAGDARALVNLDADTAEAAGIARQLLPDHTRVRTGRAGGEHTWLSLRSRVSVGEPTPVELRQRFYLRDALDWRGGNCIAVLPGSLWAPQSSAAVYEHIGGPALPNVLDLPGHLAEVFARRAPATRARSAAPSWLTRGGRAVDLTPRGAFERFLAAASAHGRLVRRTGKSGEAFVQCPGRGHPDRNRNRPCLHVTAGPGGVGLHCFGSRGCTEAEVTAAFGLTLTDLFDDLGISAADITFTDDLTSSHRDTNPTEHA